MRSLDAAVLYPGVALLEYSPDYSVGRGTNTPFQQIGATWIDGRQLAEYLNRRMIPGIRFYPLMFTPSAGKLSGTTVEGIRLFVTDREVLDSFRVGMEIAAAIVKLYPGRIRLSDNERLIGSRELIQSLERGEDPRALLSRQEAGLEEFLRRRAKYLLYPEGGRR
jgi:uncharacterized protein YbbC (DUF1343 family)